MKCLLYIFLSIQIVFFGVSNATEENKDYGHIDFPASISPKFHPLFIKGVLLLHNFQYEEAKEVFLELQKRDPEFSLGYWGEAMTYNHPLWDEQDFEKGQNALKKFALTPIERVAKAKTAQEKGFIQAINLLYSEGSKKFRDYLYAVSLLDLYQQFPEDNEIATFYALALLGNQQGTRNTTEYMKAASVANDVFTRNPKHPGAMHYLIHSVDDPVHAPMGLNAARSYSVIVPEASHAAHMPSHIYLALGLWDEVVKSNQLAWESGEKHLARKPSSSQHDIHDLHALQWLHYGYLQLGNYDEAHRILKKMYEMTKESNNPMFKWYYAHMRAAHLVTTEKYDLDLPSVDMNGVELSAVASDVYANALILLSKNKDLDSSIARLKSLQKAQAVQFANQKAPGMDYFTGIHKDGLAAAEIVVLQMMALNERAKGNLDQSMDSLKEAIQIEDKLPLGYGPPVPVKPSAEILGDFLFEDKEFLKSCGVFQEELLKLPNRLHASEKLMKIDKDLRCPKKENIFFHRLMYSNEH